MDATRTSLPKKALLLLLTVVFVFGLAPTGGYDFAYADEGDISAQSESGTVYLTITKDNGFIVSDGNDWDTTMCYVPIDLEAVSEVNLDDYGFGDYWYDADEDGNYETTALQLFIYASEQYYSGGAQAFRAAAVRVLST